MSPQRESAAEDRRRKLAGGRDAILDAAEQVVRDDGFDKLSLAAIASKLRVSKAGVLHHFGNKKQLLKELVERDFARFEKSLSSHRQSLAGSRNEYQPEFLAYFRAVLEDAQPGDALRLSLSLLSLMDPSLTGRAGPELRSRWSELDPDKDVDVCRAIAALVVDGLWINTMLATAPGGSMVDAIQRYVFEELEAHGNGV
ncbi:MAG: TetR/AcrR family transcriptional regulator [Myxococcota bacterium]